MTVGYFEFSVREFNPDCSGFRGVEPRSRTVKECPFIATTGMIDICVLWGNGTMVAKSPSAKSASSSCNVFMRHFHGMMLVEDRTMDGLAAS